MSGGDWKKANEIFVQAVKFAPAPRPSCLGEGCGQDNAMVDESVSAPFRSPAPFKKYTVNSYDYGADIKIEPPIRFLLRIITSESSFLTLTRLLIRLAPEESGL